MALRPRELNKRETILERQAREEEKLIFRTLEQCKQIPKNDRLELREEIHKNSKELIELFIRHRKNPKNLQCLQIALRKYIMRLKMERQGEILRNVKEDLIRSVEKTSQKPKSKSKNKSLDGNNIGSFLNDSKLIKPRWFKQAIQRSISQRKLQNKTDKNNINFDSNQKQITQNSRLTNLKQIEVYSPQGFKSPSDIHSAIHSPVNIQRRSGYHPKSTYNSDYKNNEVSVVNMSSTVNPKIVEDKSHQFYDSISLFNYRSETVTPSPCHQSNFTDSVVIKRASHLSIHQDQRDLFTDPKMLEECRGFLHKVKATQQTAKFPVELSTPEEACIIQTKSDVSQSSLGLISTTEQKLGKDIFVLLCGKDAEDVMSQFFDESPVITRQEFKHKVKSFRNLHMVLSDMDGSIDSYFEAISKVGQHIITEHLTVSQLGRIIEQFCPKSPTNTEVYNLFGRLDTENMGRLLRCLFNDAKWTTLFAKADYDNKGYIGYWELYRVRKSWEYINFMLWYREQNTVVSSARMKSSVELY